MWKCDYEKNDSCLFLSISYCFGKLVQRSLAVSCKVLDKHRQARVRTPGRKVDNHIGLASRLLSLKLDGDEKQGVRQAD
jgi:hypothetical protein